MTDPDPDDPRLQELLRDQTITCLAFTDDQQPEDRHSVCSYCGNHPRDAEIVLANVYYFTGPNSGNYPLRLVLCPDLDACLLRGAVK